LLITRIVRDINILCGRNAKFLGDMHGGTLTTKLQTVTMTLRTMLLDRSNSLLMLGIMVPQISSSYSDIRPCNCVCLSGNILQNAIVYES